MIFIDSHCHIDGAEFDGDRDSCVERARAAGVAAMLVVGTGHPRDEEIGRAARLAEKYENIYAAVGVHPHDSKDYTDAAENYLIGLINGSEKVVAWGEIGLDFHYDNSPRDAQEIAFRRQIRAARKIGLPVIIHSRAADAETVRVLREECAEQTENGTWKRRDDFRGGVMHCFGGTPETARDLMDIGFLISFAGNVTFKKAENLREAARVVPLDKLLIETDSPYLAPIPFRGRRNEPAFVVETAKFLAEFYDVSLAALAEKTTENFRNFFGLKSAAR